MSQADRTNPESDPLSLSDEGLFDRLPLGAEQPGEPPPPDSPLAAAAAETEASPAETEEEPAGRKKKREKKKREKRTKDRKEKEAAGVGTEPAGPPLLARLRQASPYTVLLAVALAGLVIGCLFLVLELGGYGFQFSPRK